MKFTVSTFLLALMFFLPLQAQKIVKIVAETWPNGATKVMEHYEGEKSENTLIKRETLTAGGVLIGEEKYFQGKKNGKAFKWDAFTQLKVEELYYDMGVLEGEQKMWFGDGKDKATYRYSLGKIHGEQMSWLPDGRPRLQLNYANGIPHGMQREWFEDGSSKFNLNFVAGKLDGVQRWWSMAEKINPNRPKVEETWKQGQYEEILDQFGANRPKHTKVYVYNLKDAASYANLSELTIEGSKQQTKEIIYHETGAIQTLTTMDNPPSTTQYYPTTKKMAEGKGTVDKMEGVWVWYHESGEKKMEGTYSNGNKKGKFTTWNEAGKVLSEEVFTGLGDQKESWKIWGYHKNGGTAFEGELDPKGHKDGKWTYFFENKNPQKEEVYKLMCKTPGARPFAVQVVEWDQNRVKLTEGTEREFTRYEYFPGGTLKSITRILRPFHENCSKKSFEIYNDGAWTTEEFAVNPKTGENVSANTEVILRKATLSEAGDTLKVEEYNEEGQLHGVQKGWYETGKPHYEFTYVTGKPGGPIKEWYPEGGPMLDLIYQNVGNRVLEVKRGIYYADNGKQYEYSAADEKEKKKKVVEIEEASYFMKFMAANKK